MIMTVISSKCSALGVCSKLKITEQFKHLFHLFVFKQSQCMCGTPKSTMFVMNVGGK